MWGSIGAENIQHVLFLKQDHSREEYNQGTRIMEGKTL